MNKVFLIGRLVRDVEVRYSQAASGSMAVARYSLAVPRKFKRDGEPDCDFINCVAFGKNGEFAERYLQKGTKIAVVGRIQTGSYIHKDAGIKINTFDVIVEEHEFCESKSSSSGNADSGYVGQYPRNADDGFMNIPDGIDEELPFN